MSFNPPLTRFDDMVLLQVIPFDQLEISAYRITSGLIMDNMGEGSRDIYTPTNAMVLGWLSSPHVSMKIPSLGHVDVFVTSECILLCILYIVTRCLFRDISIMYLSHVIMPRYSDRED